MQYPTTFKLVATMTFFFVLSYRQSDSKKKDIVVVETTMLPVKQDYIISWKDSSVVQFKLDGFVAYPAIAYDSAKILFYWGYNIGEGLDTASYFPVAVNGKWISTVISAGNISKADLWKIDSI
jgi:hypothetical protein